ncbi:hypothetical protein EG878_17485, partial [Enterococcus faecalis]
DTLASDVRRVAGRVASRVGRDRQIGVQARRGQLELQALVLGGAPGLGARGSAGQRLVERELPQRAGVAPTGGVDPHPRQVPARDRARRREPAPHVADGLAGDALPVVLGVVGVDVLVELVLEARGGVPVAVVVLLRQPEVEVLQLLGQRGGGVHVLQQPRGEVRFPVVVIGL